GLDGFFVGDVVKLDQLGQRVPRARLGLRQLVALARDLGGAAIERRELAGRRRRLHAIAAVERVDARLGLIDATELEQLVDREQAPAHRRWIVLAELRRELLDRVVELAQPAVVIAEVERDL